MSTQVEKIQEMISRSRVTKNLLHYVGPLHLLPTEGSFQIKYKMCLTCSDKNLNKHEILRVI